MKKLCIFLLLILTSCASKEFIILRDVPKNPTFTVIPASYAYSEVTFANRIEKYLISAGVKVIQHPGIKHIQTEQAQGKSKATSELVSETAGKALIETYRMRESTDADYIVETFHISGQIKISKNETQEILTLLTIPSARTGIHPVTTELQEFISKALRHLGIYPTQKEY